METVRLALLVPREHAESVRRRLASDGYLDPERRPLARSDGILLPLRREPPATTPGLAVSADLPTATRTDLGARLRSEVRLPRELLSFLPTRWERFGRVVVLRLSGEVWPHRVEIGRAFASVLRAETVLADLGGITGPLRRPRVEKLWGNGTETVHVENGVRFAFDASEVMFSSGNLSERIRMATLPGAGETVVDLFAGIGYFSIPMAVHSAASRIVACELNPVAHRYLVENIRGNRAWTVEPRLGDCREAAPRGEADRVVMGYLDAADYLPTGLAALRESGGWLHYHEACPDREADRPRTHVRAAATAAGFEVASMRALRLKSYAPRVGHWVVDARLQT